MKKRRLVSCMAISALVFSAALLALAAQQPPEEITIKPSIWSNLTKTSVQFTHKKHSTEYKAACNECHHVWKDGKNVWKEGDEVQTCDKCHTEPTTQGEMKLSPDQKKLNLKFAFHTQCWNCHRKLKKENPASKGPIVCSGCHPGSKAD